jgi:ribonuclease HI
MRDVALFTDVSLHPGRKLGAGAYLVVPAALLEVPPHSIERSQITRQVVIQRFGGTSSTTLEVQTVLWSLEDYRTGLTGTTAAKLRVYSDSQCIAGLLERRTGLEAKGFLSKRTGCLLKNSCLYRRFYEFYDELGFEVIKVAGHSRSCLHNTIDRIFSLVDRHVRKTLNSWLAEGQGFEPWVGLPPQRFSRPSHSTALAPLRERQ